MVGLAVLMEEASFFEFKTPGSPRCICSVYGGADGTALIG
jgi:hypothetical protein